MKVTITHEFLPRWHPFCYWARAEELGIEGCGQSWEEADARLKKKLAARPLTPTPTQEVVEI